MALNKQQIANIGKAHGMSQESADIFALFIKERFPQEDGTLYVGEWATRWVENSAWSHADDESQRVLLHVGYAGRA